MTPVNRPVTAFGALAQLHGFGKSLSVVLILFPILSALPAFIVFNNWAESKHLEKTWTIEGAACPVVGAPSPAAFAALGLSGALSQQRSNGLASMVARIRRDAELAQA